MAKHLKLQFWLWITDWLGLFDAIVGIVSLGYIRPNLALSVAIRRSLRMVRKRT